MSMFEPLKQLFGLLTPKERKRSILLLGLLIVMALMEVMGVGSILPFVKLVTDPEIISRNKWLTWVYDLLGFQSHNQFIIFSGACVLAIFITINAFHAFVVWVQSRFIFNRSYNLAFRLVQGYFSMPYEYFLNTNSSIHRRNIISEVNSVIQSYLLPFMTMLTQILVAIFILVLVIIIDPLLSLFLTVILGIPYILIFNSIKKKLSRLGVSRVEANTERIKTLDEAFGGIKDIKVLRRENYFLNLFSRSNRKLMNCFTQIRVFSEFPKLVVEPLVIGGLLSMIVYMLATGQDLKEFIPVITLFVVSVRRLMPAFQQITRNFSALRVNRYSLQILSDDLNAKEKDACRRPEGPTEKLPFKEELELRDITYRYSSSKEPVIENLQLTIKSNASIGLVGHSGGGKTTIVDIILGLLEPQKGNVLVDGVTITGKNRHRWLKNIGYVPQQIYLTDDSVLRNIAFGIPDDKIDVQAVERAAKMVFLYDFVVKELPEGFDTLIGERGVRLSGGQRQRIGIARALYHNPDVLIFDEATSSLDGITEANISEAVNDLIGAKTLIIIAHRISTVKKCDTIYLLEGGKISDWGTYEALLRKNKKFRSMAQATA